MQAKNLKYSFSLLLLLCCGTLLRAQSFTASTTDATATVNQPFDVTFTLKNLNGKNFTPPDFGTARIVAGPAQSTSTTIINGRTSSEVTLTYTLLPTQEGMWEIPPARVVSEGKVMQSNSLRIRVTQPKEIDLAGEGDLPDVFVRLEVSTDQAFTGQQILLDYRLYTVTDLQNINIVSESAYEGFFNEPLRRYNKNSTNKTINGKEYLTQIVRRIALFPQQAGTFQIEPSQLSAEIITGRRRSGFFTFSDTKPVYLTTDPVTIQVKSLPPNAPATFTGAVGDDFEVSVSIPRNTLTTDDAIALQMTMRGNGDVKRVQPPTLDFGDNFEVYEPKVLQEENYENRGQLYGKKIVEYLVLPKKPGQYRLQADFSYFEPDSTDYRTVSARSPMISVTQGINRGKRDINISSETAVADNTLRPNKTTASFSQKGSPFFGSVPFWIITALPILGFIGVIFKKKKEAGKVKLSPEELRKQAAVRVANEKLAAGKTYMEAGNSRAFYDEVQRAFLGYVGDKLQIPPARMSKRNVREKLTALDVSQANIESFIKILQTCETALFAGMDNSAAMSETYKNAEEVLVRIEEEL